MFMGELVCQRPSDAEQDCVQHLEMLGKCRGCETTHLHICSQHNTIHLSIFYNDDTTVWLKR